MTTETKQTETAIREQLIHHADRLGTAVDLLKKAMGSADREMNSPDALRGFMEWLEDEMKNLDRLEDAFNAAYDSRDGT